MTLYPIDESEAHDRACAFEEELFDMFLEWAHAQRIEMTTADKNSLRLAISDFNRPTQKVDDR